VTRLSSIVVVDSMLVDGVLVDGVLVDGVLADEVLADEVPVDSIQCVPKLVPPLSVLNCLLISIS
jgi:hypothetical protein